MNDFIEEVNRMCPTDVQSSDGHYDPAGTDVESDGYPVCAGCGEKYSKHNYLGGFSPL